MSEDAPRFVPLDFRRYPADEMLQRATRFHEQLVGRRSVREFSEEPIADDVLAACLRAAGTAPSGANRQPWTFVVVRDGELKRQIREAAEREEREFYERRITEQWREALEPFGTDANKPFLEQAPALIVVFRRLYGIDLQGGRQANYYTQESVGIAVGFLLAALHHAGLASLTHTPSPMAFLGELLQRPANERAFVLIPVGYPAEGCRVPDIQRKPFDEITIWR